MATSFSEFYASLPTKPAAEVAPAKDEPAPKMKRLSEDEMRVMRKRHEQGVERDQTNRSMAKLALAFRSGAGQWDDTEREYREGQKRPVMTFNKSGAFVRQVTGDVRQNKPAIKVSPAGSGAKKEIADAYAGLIRNIEQQSNASYVYSVAADNSVTCGFGYWRVVTQYSGDDSFEQDIRIKPIQNPLSVVCDPDAMELDRSDANWWIIYTTMSKEQFETKYPKARLVEVEKLDKDDRTTYADWFTGDTVRIAEYWCKKPVMRTLLQLSDGQVCWESEYEAEKFGGAPVANEREVETYRISQHIVSGAEELEDPRPWAGKYIPIVRVIGEEVWVDEKCVTKGLIYDAMDAMRGYNYLRTTSIEVAAMQPKAPWLLSTPMISGYESYWQRANENLPYLPYHIDPASPGAKPERVQPPVPAAGLMAEAELANRDIQSTIGIYDPQLGARSNETSGKAIMARDAQGDTGTFVWIDNLGLAISYTGRILIDLIQKIYDTRRVMRVIGDNGEDGIITINHEVQDGAGNKRVLHDPMKGLYDLTLGKYDVVVQPGPSFASRREQAAEGVKETMKVVGPAAAPLLAARLARLQDWPQAEDVAEDLEKLLPPALQKPKLDPQTGKPIPLPPPPPDPEQVKGQAQIAIMADKAKLEEASKKAQIALQKEAQDAQIALDRQKAAADYELEVWKAEQQAQLDAAKVNHQQSLADSTFDREAARNERPNEPKLDAMSKRLDEFIARLSKPPKRKRIIAYRGPNDELIGDEHFIDDDAPMPAPGPMMTEGMPLE